MNKAEQLIACLEGEIAKRDETIARLEPQLNRAIQDNYDLRTDLSAIKAQEPVADAGMVEALEMIIEMNRQHAADQFGDAEKAEAWSCIRVARAALAAHRAAPAPGGE